MRSKHVLLMLSAYFKRILILLLVSLLPGWILAQQNSSYSPCQLHSKRSSELLGQLRNKQNEELASFGASANRPVLGQMCMFRNDFLVKQVKEQAFVKNDTITRFIKEIIHRIVASNDLIERNRMVLILNTPEVNALCYGRGLYIVTVGLLGRIRSEEELAFMLCHEIAHDELRHVQENILREVDTKWTSKTREKFRKLLSDDVSSEDLASLRQWIYEASEFGRKKEYVADSMGFVLFKNSGYHQKSAINALQTLDSAKHPKYYSPDDFFSPLDADKFPFQKLWIKSRLSVFNRNPEDSFLFDVDSVRTHPAIVQRILKLNTLIDDSTQSSDRTPSIPFTYLVSTSEFQTVEAAYLASKYDQALYQILHLWAIHPHNDYLTSRATKILIDIHDSKKELATGRYASRYVGHYGERQAQVNNLLFNILPSEIGEVAFNFINNKSNFNSNQPAHYFLLWKVCSLTFRDYVRDQIEKAYENQFDKKISDYQYH